MFDRPEFAPAPDIGKLALDGAWEDAVVLRPGWPVDDRTADDWIGGRHDVACEAFFGKAFFGVRHLGGQRELTGFVKTFAAVLGAARTGSDFFTGIGDALGLPLAHDFLFAELGAEGGWRTVGPLRVADPAAALAGFDKWWTLAEKSPVGQDIDHDKALEFSYANGDGTEHWFALPVSQSGVIDRAAVRAALLDFCARSAV